MRGRAIDRVVRLAGPIRQPEVVFTCEDALVHVEMPLDCSNIIVSLDALGLYPCGALQRVS